MPQMAPSMWLTLFLVFSCTLIFFTITNYFMISPEAPDTDTNKINSPSTNWKW